MVAQRSNELTVVVPRSSQKIGIADLMVAQLSNELTMVVPQSSKKIGIEDQMLNVQKKVLLDWYELPNRRKNGIKKHESQAIKEL